MEHRYDGKASVSGALHKMKKEVTKAGKMVCVCDGVFDFVCHVCVCVCVMCVCNAWLYERERARARAF